MYALSDHFKWHAFTAQSNVVSKEADGHRVIRCEINCEITSHTLEVIKSNGKLKVNLAVADHISFSS